MGPPDLPSAYEQALSELAEAEHEAAQWKTPESLHRVVVARARATALYQHPADTHGGSPAPPRVWIGNRAL